MKTKAIKTIGALIVFVMMIAVVPTMAYAESDITVDNNDTSNSATALSSKEAVTGVISSKEDVDFYQYTVDVTGYFYFTFKNLSTKEANWNITIYDSYLNVLDTWKSRSFTEDSYTYNFAKGTVIYFKVEYYSYGEAVDKEYSISVNATDDMSWEQEYNDTKDTATVLNSKSAKHGNLYTKGDVDFYKYTVDVSGYFNFTFKNLATKEGNWYLTIYDSSLNVLDSWKSRNFTENSYTYNFKKGTVLYFKVEYYSYGEAVGKEYSIEVNAKQDSSWEQENNDTKKSATTIKSNKEIHGNLYIRDDVDYYKYTVDVSGYFNFIFKNLTTEAANWNLTIYDSSLNKIDSWKSSNFVEKSTTYNFKKGTILYFKVEYYSYGEATNKEYSLTVQAKNSASWEQENNNSYSKADTIKTNTNKYGNLYSINDIDYYSYTATKTGTLKTTFKFDADNVGRGWNVTIYDSAKKVISTVPYVTADKTISFKAKKGNKYYVVVKPASSYDIPVNITYTLKIK